jgi:hypothetical protein
MAHESNMMLRQEKDKLVEKQQAADAKIAKLEVRCAGARHHELVHVLHSVHAVHALPAFQVPHTTTFTAATAIISHHRYHCHSCIITTTELLRTAALTLRHFFCWCLLSSALHVRTTQNKRPKQTTQHQPNQRQPNQRQRQRQRQRRNSTNQPTKASIAPLEQARKIAEKEKAVLETSLKSVRESEERWQTRFNGFLTNYQQVDPEEFKQLQERNAALVAAQAGAEAAAAKLGEERAQVAAQLAERTKAVADKVAEIAAQVDRTEKMKGHAKNWKSKVRALCS